MKGEQLLQELRQILNNMERTHYKTSARTLAACMILVEKGICTQEELGNAIRLAEQNIDALRRADHVAEEGQPAE